MFLTDSQNTIIHHKKEKVYMLSIQNILQQFILLIHRTFFIKSGDTIQVIWVKLLYACQFGYYIFSQKVEFDRPGERSPE